MMRFEDRYRWIGFHHSYPPGASKAGKVELKALALEWPRCWTLWTGWNFDYPVFGTIYDDYEDDEIEPERRKYWKICEPS